MEKNLKRLAKDLSNPDEDLRALSAMTLLKIEIVDPDDREEIVKELRKATRDKNIAVRFFSRRAIDKIKRQRDAENVGAESLPLDAALQSEDFEIRMDAVMRIARDNRAEYKSQLLEMLQSEKNDFVRATLISGLKVFLSKEEARLLSRFLNDPDSRVRSNTIEALEHLKADEAIPNLFPCLEDPDNRIRAVAAKALQSFGEAKVFAGLKRMLNSKEEWMRGSAIFSLSHIYSPESVQFLIDSARTTGPVDLRVKALVALANFNDSASYGFLKLTSGTGEEPFKSVAGKALKLFEEKFGGTPPMTTILEEKKESSPEKKSAGAGSAAPPADFTATVSKFFRKGKQEAVDLSQKAAINFVLTDLEKEATELQKEAGRILFELYQRGDMKVPELLTIGHEILRMNFFIQKYSEEEEKAHKSEKGGFFSHLKALFTSTSNAATGKVSQIGKFTQKREELFQKLGKSAFFKMKVGEYTPTDLDGYFQAFQKIEEKIAKQKGNLP
jgi:HEAT repeat protein